MSLDKIKRRDFLKIMGWGGAGATLAGCDLPSYVTLEQGKEKVVAYLAPEEYVIPGVGVWYASTCQQCQAGCGYHGRVREGRVLKLEGNPDSSVNHGNLCQMGQSALQGHYNPDRITKPLARKGGSLTEITWDEALRLIDSKTGTRSGLDGSRLAWVTGTISGHQSVLLNAYLSAVGSRNHYCQEIVNDAVWRAVCRDMLGVENPRLRIDKAQTILSFGADFLGTWGSLVYNSGEFAKFRTSPRGVLVQAEPKMTLTGLNADLWLPVRSGTEGVLALGIANTLMSRSSAYHVPADLQRLASEYSVQRTADITGVPGEYIIRAADMLHKRTPSLVLAGASAQGHENGYQTVAAIMMLNMMLGNVGKTIEGGSEVPFEQMQARTGNSRDMVALADAMNSNSLDAVFFYNTNPVYTSPKSLGVREALANVGFKVALSQFKDETTMMADLVLPLTSSLEDWGSHVTPYPTGVDEISVQQPLMQKLYNETRGFGDIMLAMLKMRNVQAYAGFEDYYGYLRNAFDSMPADMHNATEKDIWMEAQKKGVLGVKGNMRSLRNNSVTVSLDVPADNIQYPYHLVPSARLGLWDGRHANLPWLQEAPDQISKIVWDSWVEMHPKTAAKLGVKQGEVVRVASEAGAIEGKAYVYKGISEYAIAIPMGQGHEEYGRYAKGRGVNPMQIVSKLTDGKTGELALYATRVQVSRVGTTDDPLVTMGGSNTQVGRKIVATVSADVYERTEGEA